MARGSGSTKELTARTLATMADGAKLSDGGFDAKTRIRGRWKGSLIARRRGANVEFSLRMRADGTDKLYRVGIWSNDGDGQGTYTLSQAREEAMRLAMKYAAEGTAFKDKREAEELAEKERQKAAREELARKKREQKQAALDAAGASTLGALCNLYVDQLAARSRRSWRDVQQMFRQHIRDALPALWKMPAREVCKGDVHSILDRMLSKKIGRRVNMMRASLHAAFELGLSLENDSHLYELAPILNITENPVARIKQRGDANRERTRKLSEDELAAYMKRIGALKSPAIKAFLQCQIRLGGQRIEQLARARWSDLQDGVLTLVDAKGKGKPRQHALPIDGKVAEIIEGLRALRTKETVQLPDGSLIERLADTPIFSTTGTKQIHGSTISAAVKNVADAMVQDADASEGFVAADIRRTAETLLAKLGVSKDIRIELLSHGRNSLIAKHYDKYEYMKEKREALRRWNRMLDVLLTEAPRQKVVPLRGK